MLPVELTATEAGIVIVGKAGAAVTASVAAVDVICWPTPSVTTTSYEPLSPGTVAEIASVSVSAPETRPPLESGVVSLRHWYVSVGWPCATTENCASEPAQSARLVGAETESGTRSCAPMSTIGGGPIPVSGEPGSSKNRGK